MRRIGLTGVAAVAVLGMALAGCTSGGPLATLPAANGASATADGSGRFSVGEADAGRARRDDHAGQRQPSGADPSKGITVTATGRHAQERQRAHRGRPRHGSYSAGNTSLAQHVGARRVAVLHGDRDLPPRATGRTTTKTAAFRTLTPASTFTHRDPRGSWPADLRRRDADHLVLQPADHEQGRGRAGAADQAPPSRWSAPGTGTDPCNMAAHLRLLPAPRLLAGQAPR